MQSSPIAEEVKQYIAMQFLDGDDEDLEPTSPLLEWGILDSVGMVKLVAHLEDRYGIRIPQSEITPSNFRDVDRISSMVVAHSTRPPAPGDAEAHVDDPELAELLDFGARVEWRKLDSGALFHTVVIDGEGPVWLLLPEPGEVSTFYADMQRALEGHHACIAVDLLGFGRSSGPSAEPTFWDQVGLLAELMRDRNDTQYVLVGTGLSAALAMELSRRVPEQTLACVSLGFGELESPASLAKVDESPEEHLSMRRRDVALVSPRELEALQTRLSAPAFGAFLDGDAEALVRGALFEQSVVPILFLAGQEDALVPTTAVERAAARTPYAEVKWLARSGHAFPRERADESVSMIRSYLAQLSPEKGGDR